MAGRIEIRGRRASLLEGRYAAEPQEGLCATITG